MSIAKLAPCIIFLIYLYTLRLYMVEPLPAPESDIISGLALGTLFGFLWNVHACFIAVSSERCRWTQCCPHHVSQGNYEDAYLLLKRVLVIDEKVHGQDHAKVGVTLNNQELLLERQVRGVRIFGRKSL